jgi:hypothetical protein
MMIASAERSVCYEIYGLTPLITNLVYSFLTMYVGCSVPLCTLDALVNTVYVRTVYAPWNYLCMKQLHVKFVSLSQGQDSLELQKRGRGGIGGQISSNRLCWYRNVTVLLPG